MRHLLTIIRSWFNKHLPQGGLVSLVHSALWMKVDDTCWFCLAEDKCSANDFPFHFNKPALEAPNDPLKTNPVVSKRSCRLSH